MDFAPVANYDESSAPLPMVSTVDGSIYFENTSEYNSQPYYKDGKYSCDNYNWISVKIITPSKQTVVYGHLSPKSKELDIWGKNGTIVKRGDVIGFMGNTGCSTSHHLHYQINGYDTNEFYSSLSDSAGLYNLPENIRGIYKKSEIDEYFKKFLNNESNILINF